MCTQKTVQQYKETKRVMKQACSVIYDFKKSCKNTRLKNRAKLIVDRVTFRSYCGAILWPILTLFTVLNCGILAAILRSFEHYLDQYFRRYNVRKFGKFGHSEFELSNSNSELQKFELRTVRNIPSPDQDG